MFALTRATCPPTSSCSNRCLSYPNAALQFATRCAESRGGFFIPLRAPGKLGPVNFLESDGRAGCVQIADFRWHIVDREDVKPSKMPKHTLQIVNRKSQIINNAGPKPRAISRAR